MLPKGEQERDGGGQRQHEKEPRRHECAINEDHRGEKCQLRDVTWIVLPGDRHDDRLGHDVHLFVV